MKFNNSRGILISMIILLRIIWRNLFSGMKLHFLTGLIVIFPSALTIFIVLKCFDLIGLFFVEIYGSVMPFWLGFTLTFLLIAVIGLLAKNIFGNRILSLFEWIMKKIPGVSYLYSTIKQLIDLIVNNKKMMFSNVAMIEYPSKGIYTLGFVTSNSPEELSRKAGRDLVAIFISTTPNPTSGLIIFMPKDEVIELDMSVEEGMKLIISGGLLKPGENQGKLEENLIVNKDEEKK